MTDQNKTILEDMELEKINGGATKMKNKSGVEAICPFCNEKTEFEIYSGGRGKCLKCGKVSFI